MEQRHSAITDEELEALEGSIGDLLLKLGLQTPEPARYRGDIREIWGRHRGDKLGLQTPEPASPMPSPHPRRTPKHYHYPYHYP